MGVTFNGLHSVIYQKTGLFIATAVRTSNPLDIMNAEVETGLQASVGCKQPDGGEFTVQWFLFRCSFKWFTPFAGTYISLLS
jgi:hypothetical protein